MPGHRRVQSLPCIPAPLPPSAAVCGCRRAPAPSTPGRQLLPALLVGQPFGEGARVATAIWHVMAQGAHFSHASSSAGASMNVVRDATSSKAPECKRGPGHATGMSICAGASTKRCRWAAPVTSVLQRAWGWTSVIKVSAGLVPPEAPVRGCLLPVSSQGHPRAGLCPDHPILRSYTHPIGLGPPLMASFYFNLLCKNFFPNTVTLRSCRFRL